MATFFGLPNWRSSAETKVSLKAESKRLRKQTMLFCILIAMLPVTSTANYFPSFREANKGTVDLSSMMTCFGLGGQKIERVADNEEKGYKCTVNLRTLTKNDKQAQEACESRIPYYITASEHGTMTKCTFQINLECAPGFWQIKGKCYNVLPTKHTWEEAQKACINDDFKNNRPKIAEFYSDSLRIFFNDILNIRDAWVYVPNMKDYFTNGEGNAGVYVQEGAYRYDVRPGTIIMDETNVEHQVICEYTPSMTKAEMFYIGEIYSEIYPITVYEEGAILPTSSYMTIQQTDFAGGKVEHFTTAEFDKRCLAIGNILNVESYPITAIEQEYNDVRTHLNDHNFYLTNAYKNDGCSKKNYVTNQSGTALPIFENENFLNDEQVCNAHSFSFHKSRRFATMAAMRAPVICTLHTFNWKFGDCPRGPSWSEEPVNNKDAVSRDEAVRMCREDGLKAALSGFDEAEEFDVILQHVNPVYTDKVQKGARGGPDDHYWLGGRSPCESDCYSKTGERYVASWDNGVAVHSEFLNEHNHKGHTWMDTGLLQYLAFRRDGNAFHVHTPGEIYVRMFFICGKSAPFERSERQKGDIKAKG